MARTLIENVWANGQGYGPAHGRLILPEGVGEDLPDHVFADDGDDRVEVDLPDPPPTEGERNEFETGGVLQADGSMVGWGSLDDLDKPALLDLAERRGIAEVSPRWGAKRIRETLRDAEAG
ncbi:MAG TPA: hypothetical protein VHK88_20175 [Aquihabitans sp.]|jgi:hypothetical protein|nr:hypothetical protein [Aquihabitans sp.]